jgi:hypothetical protein
MAAGQWDAAYSQNKDCSAARTKWEQLFNEVKTKLQEFTMIQQTPVERVVQKPIIDRSEIKTIAKQVSEAVQAKEDLLSAKRKECRNLMNAETQAFNEFQECSGGKNSKDKETKNLVKKRTAFVEKTLLALSEVREIEGKETGGYASSDQPQANNYQSVNNYWQNYQQMYRRWWGQ